jgi:uncharacterized membrane-anchored protein
MAQISLPEGFLFADKAGTRRFLELTENPTSGSELGTVLRQDGESQWFVVFEFRDVGYVKDDDKNALDAGALLASIKEGTEAGNAERRKRGWATMDIVGWEKSPFYDPSTHNLTWAIRGRSGAEETVNYSVRLLGRGGVMSADLVLSPPQLQGALPEFNGLLGDFSFKSGHRYAEWRQGDKVAAYGLTALVAGGAGAALAKSGLLGKLWKVIVGGVIALAALIRKLFGGGRRESAEQSPA